jgi:hypothetical protein
MKMMTRIAILSSLLGLAACQTMPYQPYAREVKKKPGVGGTIALKAEHRDEDRAKAQQMMDANCQPATVNVTEEGEIAVGSTTNTSGSETHHAGAAGTKVGSFFGMPITSGGHDPSNDSNSTATTTAIKEWNISYECQKVVAESPAPGKKKKTHKE